MPKLVKLFRKVVSMRLLESEIRQLNLFDGLDSTTFPEEEFNRHFRSGLDRPPQPCRTLVFTGLWVDRHHVEKSGEQVRWFRSHVL